MCAVPRSWKRNEKKFDLSAGVLNAAVDGHVCMKERRLWQINSPIPPSLSFCLFHPRDLRFSCLQLDFSFLYEFRESTGQPGRT
jgi:hypothetical protein